MLTADEFLPRSVKVTSKAKFVTWELSSDKTPTVLDEPPNKNTEVEVLITRALAGKTGQHFSAREVAKMAGTTNYLTGTVLKKMARHDKVERVFGKHIRYKVL